MPQTVTITLTVADGVADQCLEADALISRAAVIAALEALPEAAVLVVTARVTPSLVVPMPMDDLAARLRESRK